MYNCGPTVYSDPHIGNFRSFLIADLLRRFLEYIGYDVKQIMNITDVGHLQEGQGDEGEDKMEIASRREQKSAWEIADYYTDVFMDLLHKLNVRSADRYPRATEHIDEMIQNVQQLIDNGHGYVVDGEVYYDVTSFPSYGKLSDNTLDQLQAGKRVDIDPKKKNPWDFALWKQDPKHQMQWESPWGKGFPGWHIECSTMATTYLGDQIDIHTGGEDNIFPHHESEIAQTEGITSKEPYVRCWLHVRHLKVNGEKMSKSLGNFYTVEDILNKGYAPEVLRLSLINAHYRQNMDFSMQRLEECQKQIQQINQFRKRMNNIAQSDPSESANFTDLTDECEKARNRFQDCLANDLNISGAIGVIFEFMNTVNRESPSPDGARNVLRLFNEWNEVLAVFPERSEEKELTSQQKQLIHQREEARQAGHYERADELRKKLKEQGILVEDTPDGPRWTFQESLQGKPVSN